MGSGASAAAGACSSLDLLRNLPANLYLPTKDEIEGICAEYEKEHSELDAEGFRPRFEALLQSKGGPANETAEVLSYYDKTVGIKPPHSIKVGDVLNAANLAQMNRIFAHGEEAIVQLASQSYGLDEQARFARFLASPAYNFASSRMDMFWNERCRVFGGMGSWYLCVCTDTPVNTMCLPRASSSKNKAGPHWVDGAYGSAKAGASVGEHYGITLEELLAEDAPETLVAKLGLRPEVLQKQPKTAEVFFHFAGSLSMYVALSMQADDKRFVKPLRGGTLRDLLAQCTTPHAPFDRVIRCLSLQQCGGTVFHSMRNAAHLRLCEVGNAVAEEFEQLCRDDPEVMGRIKSISSPAPPKYEIGDTYRCVFPLCLADGKDYRKKRLLGEGEDNPGVLPPPLRTVEAGGGEIQVEYEGATHSVRWVDRIPKACGGAIKCDGYKQLAKPQAGRELTIKMCWDLASDPDAGSCGKALKDNWFVQCFGPCTIVQLSDGSGFVNPGQKRGQFESTLRQSHHGMLLPPEEFWAGTWHSGTNYAYGIGFDYNISSFVAAVAAAADDEFHARVRAALAPLQEAAASSDSVLDYRAAPPKKPTRMLNKLYSDHKNLERPRPDSNADVVRCAITCDPAHVVPVCEAVDRELARNGGGLRRTKNGFALSHEEAADCFHYRSLLQNFLLVCEGVTYADVLPHFERICPTLFFNACCGEQARGQKYIVDWLKSPEIASQPVKVLVETQVMLPMHLRSRMKSHWPYKIFRCERNSKKSHSAWGLCAPYESAWEEFQRDAQGF